MDTIYESANNFIKLEKNTDIAIEKNPVRLIDAILNKTPQKITDDKLNKSKMYKEILPYMGSVKERVSDMRFLEKCLDSSDFMRIYQAQSFGSFIGADYFIESYCKNIRGNVYIFIKKREESDNYVIISFFRKKVVFKGIATHWLLKEKITENTRTELYRRDSFKRGNKTSTGKRTGRISSNSKISSDKT
ncbi:MAG: hypothetical protein PUD20_02860 [bacterium]|nr:hypothetical protein [bacterium]